MIVKPAPGLKVRDPVTKQLLPPEGIEVSDSSIFWTRAMNDGDVVIGNSVAPVRAPQAKGDAQ